MVYCDLKSTEGSKLVYAIGGRVDDITGELEINKEDLSYRITKEPKNSFLYERHIESMLARHKKEFAQGIYREKMSHEIG